MHSLKRKRWACMQLHTVRRNAPGVHILLYFSVSSAAVYQAPAVLFGNNCNMIMLFYMITHSIKAGHIPIASHFGSLKKPERPQYLFHLLRCTISPYISFGHKITSLIWNLREQYKRVILENAQMYTGRRPNSTRSVQ